MKFKVLVAVHGIASCNSLARSFNASSEMGVVRRLLVRYLGRLAGTFTVLSALARSTPAVSKRLAQLESGTKVGQASGEIFQSYDLDGDGFITREP